MLPPAPLVSGKERIPGELSLVGGMESDCHSACARAPSKSVHILESLWEDVWARRGEWGKSGQRIASGVGKSGVAAIFKGLVAF